jgi:2-polyprenyl-6-methoxyphenol hydroxylase-like FAD-dependent oxidoreductase
VTLQALIIGAGPVGMTMASELTRYGVQVRIVDKAAHRTDKSKALVIWSRTLEMLDRGGGAAPFIAAGMKVDAANFIAGDKVVGRIEMGHVASPYPFGLMLPQSETERLLEERLARQGVAVERSVELVSFDMNNNGTDAVLRHADGQKEHVSAAWLIGCDGAHSAVRHGLDASFDGETMDSDWILADVHVQGYPVPDSEISIYWHHEGVFVILPIMPGRYRLLADLPPSGADYPPTPTLAEVQAIMDRRGPSGLVASDPVWLAGFRINGRKVSAYRFGRAFLAGDAAHVHSPAGGQGMNTGMQDAFNLAWKLAMTIQGRGTEKLLDSYSTERSKVGDAVLHAADRITWIGTLKNPIAQGLRNFAGHLVLGLAPVRDAMADTMTEVSIGYPNSPLNGDRLRNASGPQPGGRVMPVAGQTPIGSGSVPRFALFAQPTAALAELRDRFADLLDPEIRPPFDTGGIWLVRPDGYVACSTDDAAVVGRYLDALRS